MLFIQKKEKRKKKGEFHYMYQLSDDDFHCQRINSLTNNKILDVTKLNAFADEKLIVAKMTISLFDRRENTVGKGKNAGY